MVELVKYLAALLRMAMIRGPRLLLAYLSSVGKVYAAMWGADLGEGLGPGLPVITRTNGRIHL